MISIRPYDGRWPSEFEAARRDLRAALGAAALAVEHIGSTAVPGLGARDIVDIQVSVAELDPGLVGTLDAHGWRARSGDRDVFHGIPPGSPELAKLYAREPEGRRRIHVHVRQAGRFNHRFALLFRDFLRADDNACEQYEALKRQAAAAHPDDVDGYLAIKTPVFNLLYQMAEEWARSNPWDESRYLGGVGRRPGRGDP